MGIGDCLELLTTKYSLFEGQRCMVTGESRDGRRWLVETGEQISKDREGYPPPTVFVISSFDQPLQVVFVHGRYYSLANRRLAVYRLLEMGHFLRDPIKAILVEGSDSLKHKFTTKCDGEWVDLRGANSQWIGRTVHETNCWLHTTRLGAPEQMVYHQEKGLGQILGDADNHDRGDVLVKFQHSTQDRTVSTKGLSPAENHVA
eukprot:Skav215161  [mRNA]  locus=scaffold2298:24252:26211:- [translate_table: standard]